MNEKTIDKWTKHGGFRSLLKCATRCGVKITILSKESHVLKLEYGREIEFLKGANAPVMRKMGNLTLNKDLTKRVLEEIGVRTPRGIVAASIDDAIKFVKKHQMPFPLILKPTHGSRALGVTWNIRSEKDLREAFSNFETIKREHSLKKDTVLVEEMFIGHEFRVLVLNGRIISCVQKIPASIVGDGASSIKKLIDAFNKTRLRGFKIRLDDIAENTIAENGLTLDSVLPKGKVLRLRNNLNMSDGGRSIDVTSSMHQSFKDLCVKATQIIGLSFAGVDVIAKDLSKPARRDNYVILELNPNPYYNMNEKPLVEGKGIDVSFLLLKQLFPKISKDL